MTHKGWYAIKQRIPHANRGYCMALIFSPSMFFIRTLHYGQDITQGQSLGGVFVQWV